MRRPVRSMFAVAAATLTTIGLVAAAPPSDAAPVSLASGVSLNHQLLTFEGHRESIWTLSVVLSAHNQLVSTTPGHAIGSKRADLLALAKQEKAIAGINGDTLYYVNPTVQPHSGVMYQGRTLKSPVKGQDSVFYTTRTNHAYIGDVGFTGSFSTGPRRNKTIASYNSLETAKNGAITFTDFSELSLRSMKTIGNASQQRVTPRCTFVGLSRTATDTYKVTSYRTNLTSYTRVARGTYGLYTCGSDSKSYLADTIRVGHTITANTHYAVGNMVSMISGVRRLVAGGKAYNDKNGLNDLGPSMLPETFACILPGASHVLLGTVDGKTSSSAGMTYAMLTRYLVGRLHCASAVAMDGSTDSQLVAQRPHSSLAFQNHLTYKSGNKPNGLVDGLLVVRK